MSKLSPTIEQIPQKNAKIKKRSSSYMGPSNKSIEEFKCAEFKTALLCAQTTALLFQTVFIPNLVPDYLTGLYVIYLSLPYLFCFVA